VGALGTSAVFLLLDDQQRPFPPGIGRLILICEFFAYPVKRKWQLLLSQSGNYCLVSAPFPDKALEPNHLALAPIVGGKLNLKLIRTQWREVLRLAASIRHGTLTAVAGTNTR
jgi:hypothetical protein